MKRKTIFLVLLFLILIGGIFYYYNSKKSNKEISFVFAKAKYGFISKSISATGTIQPVDTVSVGAQVSGVVKNIYVDFNSVVKKGQLLAKIDPSIILAQTEVAKANLETAKSNLIFQESNYERQNKLFQLGVISKAEYQLALNQFNNAKAAFDNTSSQLKITQKSLSYTDIFSPIDGVILNRNVSEGQTIASSFNAPTLFIIAKDLTKMQVRAAVDEADIGGVKSGQEVTFTVDAFPNDTFRGQVQRILLHPTVTANVVTYKTLINVENEAMKLKPGMTASIYIYTEQDNKALLIPSRAINFKPDSLINSRYIVMKTPKKKSFRRSFFSSTESVQKAFVWIKRGDTLKEKSILIGINDDLNIKVIEGLSSNEEFILSVMDSNSNINDTAQRSPFMPQMHRPTSKSPRN